MDALLRSRSALVFGGYNSLMDVLGAGLPALVILRQLDDGEQQQHLEKLKAHVGSRLQIVSETAVGADELARHLLANMNRGIAGNSRINLQGAENTAKKIVEMLD